MFNFKTSSITRVGTRFLLVASIVAATACGTTTVVEARPVYPSCSLIDSEGFCVAGDWQFYYADGFYWYPYEGVWYRRGGLYGPWVTVEVGHVPYRVFHRTYGGHFVVARSRPHAFDRWGSARSRDSMSHHVSRAGGRSRR